MSFASLGNVPPAVSDVVEAAEGDKPIAACCRTSALGGHAEQCDKCKKSRISYC